MKIFYAQKTAIGFVMGILAFISFSMIWRSVASRSAIGLVVGVIVRALIPT